jgi:hypothetical protein
VPLYVRSPRGDPVDKPKERIMETILNIIISLITFTIILSALVGSFVGAVYLISDTFNIDGLSSIIISISIIATLFALTMRKVVRS